MLSSLRMIARVKRISALTEESGLTRNGIQKALSEQAKIGFDSINAVMNAMGYHLRPQKIEMNK